MVQPFTPELYSFSNGSLRSQVHYPCEHGYKYNSTFTKQLYMCIVIKAISFNEHVLCYKYVYEQIYPNYKTLNVKLYIGI